MKKSRNFIFILLTILLVGISCSSPNYYREYQKFNSPNNQYSLVIYIKHDNFNIGFSGSSSYASAYVVLKDKKNDRILVKPNVLSPCKFIIGDLEVDWEAKNNKVYFTKFNYIDLKTMKISCMDN